MFELGRGHRTYQMFIVGWGDAAHKDSEDVHIMLGWGNLFKCSYWRETDVIGWGLGGYQNDYNAKLYNGTCKILTIQVIFLCIPLIR